MLNQLSDLFESSTIKPTYDYVHVILALYIFGENSDGIGRYRLTKDLLIGSGTARSLITKLNEKIKFITVLSNNNKNKGHIITEKGNNYLTKFKGMIPLIKEVEGSVIKEIIIEFKEEVNPYYCLVKRASNQISNGIDQRDAAIKVGGTGATCLIYNGTNLVFPSVTGQEKDSVEKKVLNYFKDQLKTNNLQFDKEDVIIIGSGDNPQQSRLSALNAALTLISN